MAVSKCAWIDGQARFAGEERYGIPGKLAVLTGSLDDVQYGVNSRREMAACDDVANGAKTGRNDGR